MEETPKSARTKSKPPASSFNWSTSAKFICLIVRISSPYPIFSKRAFVFFISIGSTSKAYKCPFPSKQLSIFEECPPYPNVASSPVCPGWIWRKSKISCTQIEMCIPAGVPPF